jgi:hypothetical protein
VRILCEFVKLLYEIGPNRLRCDDESAEYILYNRGINNSGKYADASPNEGWRSDGDTDAMLANYITRVLSPQKRSVGPHCKGLNVCCMKCRVGSKQLESCGNK